MTADSIAQLLREAAEVVERCGYSILASDLEQEAASLEAQEPVAWCFTDVNGKPKELCDHPKHRAEQDTRIYTALYRHPPTSAVPDAHEIWAAAQLAPGEGIEDGVLRVSALLVGSDRAVPECPYPCGWRELYSIVTRDSAWIARSLDPDKPVTEDMCSTVIRLNGYLREIISKMLKSPMPESKGVQWYRNIKAAAPQQGGGEDE